MKIVRLALLIAVVSAPILAEGQQDNSPHTIQQVKVEENVSLEVLDWGGTGRPMIFLAGLGNTAHIFDKLAPIFTNDFHVLGITRRGFGSSSKPEATVANYTSDRLGDDVLSVMAALKLDRPILVGHSIGGEELSSIGSRYPDKIRALIYLDAVNGYSFYSPAQGDWILDMIELHKKIEALKSGAAFDMQFGKDMLDAAESLEKSLKPVIEEGELMPPYTPHPPSPISVAIRFGQEKYTTISAPILVIAACPHNFDRAFKNDPRGETAMIAHDRAVCSTRLDAFASAEPMAHIVRIPNASHFIFESNQDEVIKSMRAYLPTLR